MLDNLRAMGVFARVVECGSFSGAAKELGITTSAVSQQIRSLEQDVNVILLHRSTRRINLTEAGHAFFQSCQEMMAAAERGKIRISELQDDLVGDLKIATTPILGVDHVVPALSRWIEAHSALTFSIEADYNQSDLIAERVDIALRMAESVDEDIFEAYPLAKVEQILLASPAYLNQSPAILKPQDLEQHKLVSVDVIKDYSQFTLEHINHQELVNVAMDVKVKTNNMYVMKTLSQYGHGICRALYLDVQHEMREGKLVQILPEWKLSDYTLYAITIKREQQPVKILRCLEALKSYFIQQPGGRS